MVERQITQNLTLRTFLVLALFVSASLIMAEEPYRAEDWKELKEKIRKKFPGAPVLSVPDFEKEDRTKWTILDCRTDREYKVSHIPGAVHAEDEADALRAIREGKKDKVVVYCSVGYRSGKLVEKLKERNIPNVFNLEGSIFVWANRDNPLEDSKGKPAKKVDRYGWRWGKYLKPEYRE